MIGSSHQRGRVLTDAFRPIGFDSWRGRFPSHDEIWFAGTQSQYSKFIDSDSKPKQHITMAAPAPIAFPGNNNNNPQIQTSFNHEHGLFCVKLRNTGTRGNCQELLQLLNRNGVRADNITTAQDAHTFIRLMRDAGMHLHQVPMNVGILQAMTISPMLGRATGLTRSSAICSPIFPSPTT